MTNPRPPTNRYTKFQKQEIENLVMYCRLSRLSVAETQQLIHDKLGFLLSIDWINHLRNSTRANFKRQLNRMMKDQYEFIFHYTERIDEVKNQQNEFWINYKQIKDPVSRINCLKEARDQTVLLTDLIEHLPIIAGLAVKQNDITETRDSEDSGTTEQETSQRVFS
jgi:Asp-tRNA(Asn)/Glu-tRNA(Gln) amidotransferase C subunit